MNKKGVLFLLSIVMILVLAACGEKENTNGGSKDKQVLILGTSADFPPFESYNPEGEIVGFDIDIAKLVADELGVELKIEDMDFNGLIAALQTNRVDMVMAGMSATEERRKNVEFSSEYHRSGEMFVTKQDSEITSLDDISGKVVGVQLGTIQEEGAKNLQKEIDFEVKLIDSATTLIQELLTGRIDIAYMDQTVAEGYIQEQNLKGFEDPTSSSPGMAIAFPKDGELVEEVSAIIDQLIEDGTIAQLEEKWGLNK